ncbi:putative YigZ family protein [Algoriphagus iocasae]|jgi:uncharacterized YigZ family protein|uniref:Putative YigZ family protein n=1 Tax=Algoriphagus iocasae TaxID=1836499 RepID=A0A841MA76_9BACT|nr:YigZ family protein [Algoriphagus iocasae]MBB6324852.1 putative YigZ family protein [Algoriphagus iocasae]
MNLEELDDTYLTIQNVSEGLFKDRSSKFFYFAFPVRTEDQIKEKLAELRKTYYDARHHCYAYALGKDADIFRAVDDGEPNHSAGDPILGQIRSNNLTNILIVVVRYFGGTKLGMSGLIQAYKTSAAMAIEENVIVEEKVLETVKIRFQYPSMNEVMKLVKTHELEITDQEMGLDCQMTIEFRKGIETILLDSLEEIEELEILT